MLIWLFTLGGMLLCSVLGATSGAVLDLMLRARYAAQNSWRPFPQLVLDDSADRLVVILLNDDYAGTIYVQTAAQVIYSCPNSHLSEQVRVKCTSLPSGVMPTPVFDDSCELWRIHPPPTPPGAVISQVQICPPGADVWYQETDVLLEDGSLWKWAVSGGEAREIIICPAALGWLLGTVLGLGMGIRVYLRRRKNNFLKG